MGWNATKAPYGIQRYLRFEKAKVITYLSNVEESRAKERKWKEDPTSFATLSDFYPIAQSKKNNKLPLHYPFSTPTIFIAFPANTHSLASNPLSCTYQHSCILFLPQILRSLSKTNSPTLNMLDFIRQSRSEHSPHWSSVAKADDLLEMSTSRHSSVRSSLDDGPSKGSSVITSGSLPAKPQRHTSTSTHASTTHGSHTTPTSVPPKPLSPARATPFGSMHHAMQNTITPTHARPTSPRFSQASSVISKPSPRFIATHGEFHPTGNTTGSIGSHSCVAQADMEDGIRGSKNPHGLSLDRSAGYFPKSEPGTPRQSVSNQLNDRLSLEDLLRVIAAERLHHMPQKGSDWDRSIRALESMFVPLNTLESAYKMYRLRVESVWLRRPIQLHCRRGPI